MLTLQEQAAKVKEAHRRIQNRVYAILLERYQGGHYQSMTLPTQLNYHEKTAKIIAQEMMKIMPSPFLKKE